MILARALASILLLVPLLALAVAAAACVAAILIVAVPTALLLWTFTGKQDILTY